MSASTTGNTTPSILSSIQGYFGGTVTSAVATGNGIINTGTNAASGSMLGVPMLTLSMIAITSIVMAYVTMGDTSSHNSTITGTLDSIASAPTKALGLSGGKGNRSRKTGRGKKRVTTHRKGGR